VVVQAVRGEIIVLKIVRPRAGGRGRGGTKFRTISIVVLG
jgi:hypothetical protein